MTEMTKKCYDMVDEFLKKRFLSEDEIWNFYIAEMASFLNCEAATYFEANDEKKVLMIKEVLGPVSREIGNVAFKYEGIAGWCAENKTAIFSSNVMKDPRFSRKMDFASGFRTSSILAYPCLAGGKIIGVAEFINSKSGEFSEEEFMAGRVVTRLVSQYVYILRLEETIKKLSFKGESTINNLSGGFIGVDLEGKIIFFNPKAKEIFEVGDEYSQKSLGDLANLCPEFVERLNEVLKVGKTVRRQEVKCLVGGRAKVIGYSSISIKGVDGKSIGAGVIFQDITNL